MARRHPAGTTQGGQFAPGASPDSPAAPDGLALAAAASEIDALAARAAVTVGEWEPAGPVSPATGRMSFAGYESHGCSTQVGPLSGPAQVTLQTVMAPDGGWTAKAILHDPGAWGRLLATVTVMPNGAAPGQHWPGEAEAMAALEAVLAASPEAEDLTVTRDVEHNQTSGIANAIWDWPDGCWKENL